MDAAVGSQPAPWVDDNGCHHALARALGALERFALGGGAIVDLGPRLAIRRDEVCCRPALRPR